MQYWKGLPQMAASCQNKSIQTWAGHAAESKAKDVLLDHVAFSIPSKI